jgi:hypothetical protein
MMLDQINIVVPNNPSIDTAWTILEAANHLGDSATVELCRGCAVVMASRRHKSAALAGR